MKRLAPIVLLVVALAGCGGKGGSKKQAAAPAGGGKTIQVKETEFHLAPAKITIASTGSVTFDGTNAGKIDHALEIADADLAERMAAFVDEIRSRYPAVAL